MDPVVQTSVAFALAALWLTGAARKLVRFREFGATVSEYRVLPGVLTFPSATLVIGLELGLAIALLTPALRWLGLVGSCGLLMLYVAVIGVNLLRGRRDIDCGCSGPGTHQPLGGWLVWRNLGLIAGSLVGLLPAAARPLVWVDSISIAATVVVLGTLYAAVNGLAANARELMG